MKNRKLIGMAVMCAVLAAGSARAAGTEPAAAAAPGAQIATMLSRLDLTGDQKTAIAYVIKNHRDANRAALDEVIDARKALFAQIHADTVDETAIRAAARQAAGAEEDLAVLRARTIADVKAVLTPAQREILKGVRATAQTALEKQRGRIPAMVDAWVAAQTGE